MLFVFANFVFKTKQKLNEYAFKMYEFDITCEKIINNDNWFKMLLIFTETQ